MSKRLVFIAFGLVAALISCGLYGLAPKGLQQLDLRMKDARFRVRGPVLPDRNVVIVAIDHKSIKEIGRWPWSREITGRLIENLDRQGAKVTALDLVFSEPQTVCDGRSPDAALSDSINGAGNVVMGYFFRNEQQQTDPKALQQMEKSRIRLIRLEQGVTGLPLASYPYLDHNLAMLGKGAADFGFFNASPDADGLYRRAILLLGYEGQVYPSLALKALGRYTGDEIMLDVKSWGVDSLQLGRTIIPSREDGTMSLNFYGPAGTFTTVSAADVIKMRIKPGSLQGKMVFVGATEIGIYDIRPTPFDATQPGVELHATVAANALERRFLKYDGINQITELGMMVILPVLLGLFLAFVPGTFAGLASFASTTGVFVLFNYFAFSIGLRDLTIIYPLIGIGLTYLGSEAWRNLVVERKGRQLKKAFSSYVSPDLVRQIEKDPDRLVLGGEQREISILFSDIRGFTSVSEQLSPADLVALLNEYLSPMTRIVLEEKGTLDKFIGDAVMALFNAPLDLPDHATRACSSAVRMLKELDRLNTVFESRGMQRINIGIGINTGLAVVGNMGADIRFDYTAIGDAVNLASRLEGQNKFYGSRILVSDATRSQVTDEQFLFREVDRIKVKGKQQPVVMYELMVDKKELLPEFEKGLQLYREKVFSQALQVFEQLSAAFDDGPSQIYIQRCKDYLDAPPPADWDGVYTAKGK